MVAALTAVEAAIGEVSKARQLVTRKGTRQVSAADEVDHLKSVAFAWFETHRIAVASHPSQPDLSEVDSTYQTVMDSTSRHAARSTYTDALFKAKRLLVEVRGHIAAKLHTGSSVDLSASSEPPPNFTPLASDPKMQVILQCRWDEVQRCIACKANLAATVMMGGLLETLLLARINSSPDKGKIFTAKAAPRDKAGKTLALSDWKLVQMVEVAHEVTWITKSAKDVGNVLRDFRNYIHPHKELTDGVLIHDEDARMFWEVTKSVTRHVLASVGKTP